MTHQWPLRCPTTTCGNTMTEDPLCSSNVNDPKATGANPGNRTSSRTTAVASKSRHRRSGLREPIQALHLGGGRAPPADQTFAPAYPGER
jgi:hypothetical protein